MSTNDLTVTLVGWVGTEPKHYTGASTTPFTSFRMANTRRYFDRAQNVWADGRTEWFTVKVWRQSALNVAASLRKGDPVLVHGRLATEQWDSPEGPRTSLVLEALAIGPDLTYGRATFARTVHVTDAAHRPAGVDDGDGSDVGVPAADETAGAPGDVDPWASDLAPAGGLGGSAASGTTDVTGGDEPATDVLAGTEAGREPVGSGAGAGRGRSR
jgi:single-strand DNA-binding protein